MISRPSHLSPPRTSRLSVVRLSVVRLSAELIWAASESVGSECGYTAEENGCPAPSNSNCPSPGWSSERVPSPDGDCRDVKKESGFTSPDFFPLHLANINKHFSLPYLFSLIKKMSILHEF